MSTKGRTALIILIILLAVTVAYLVWPKSAETNQIVVTGTVKLPEPQINGTVSVEQAIHDRRSVRRYTNESLTLQDVSQLMWAAQGITDQTTKFRTVPSGGHTYPLEVYILVGKGGVNGLNEGVYHYNPFNHALDQILGNDVRSDLSQAANGQPWVKEAPVNIIITGNYQKMIDKYKDEKLSTRFVDMEAGHAGQNIYLVVESRGLATVALGSFKDDQVHTILNLPSNEKTLYIYPVGHSGL
ncbi:SagB/ThcOx family dehydrogenase [Methanobacterium sp. ACI-7]|uniref:SagB/ThcOx family dehydrogenase n=1 Tax=unclassified Methanobacterium TaxID=2627676 RepID=UPI0039C2EF6B